MENKINSLSKLIAELYYLYPDRRIIFERLIAMGRKILEPSTYPPEYQDEFYMNVFNMINVNNWPKY